MTWAQVFIGHDTNEPEASRVQLCGACHQWGADPLLRDGACKTCDRTEAQIRDAHVVVRLDSLTRACVNARNALELRLGTADQIVEAIRHSLERKV